jgi:hypothetical protein
MNSTTKLASVALGAALVSAGCFGCAYKVATANDSGSKEIISREMPWDGSTSLTLGVRSVVRYVQAPGVGKVIATGPHRSVSTLVVSNGDIRDQLLHTGATLELVVTAPAISHFHLDGGSSLTIEGYDQKSLFISTQGKAQVVAAGRVNDVTVEMQGRGTINLAKLSVESASASIGGMSTLVLAPSQRAKLDVRNFASAVLLSRPSDLTTSLLDSGRVVDAAAQ